MSQTSCFRIHSLWPGREETIASVSARLRAFLALSKSPPGRSWNCAIPPDSYCDLQAHPEYIETHIEREMKKAEDWGQLPGTGFLGHLSTKCGEEAPSADDPYIAWCVGHPRKNYFQIYTDNQGQTDPRFVAYDVMRNNVLSVAVAFEPDWCEAGPMKLFRYLDTEPYVRPPIELAWMVWLSPAYARVVKPPRPSWQIIVEPLDDGSLFMATGRDTFDVDGYLHLEKARALHRQIDPLNYTVPFNGQCGRSDRVPPFPQF